MGCHDTDQHRWHRNDGLYGQFHQSADRNEQLYRNIVLANDGTTMYGLLGNGTDGQHQLYTIDVATGALRAGAFISGTGLGT